MGYFIMNQDSESYRQNLYMRIGVMKDSKTKTEESTSLTHWVVSFLLLYILRDVSFTEVGRIFRVVFREPIHLCTCVSEEGTDGEPVLSETPSLLSLTLTYVSFGEVGSIFRVAFWEPIHLCTCVREEGVDGEAPRSETPFLEVYYESIKREPKIRGIYECRCDERWQTKTKEFTRLPYTFFIPGSSVVC